MILRDISFPTPEENILFDEVLLFLAEQGTNGEALRFWESAQIFIVLGRIGRVEEDVYLETARRDGIPIFRRGSGGGTVLQGKGCLNYSLILSKEIHPEINDLRKSYPVILNQVIVVMEQVGVKAEFKPISDLAWKNGEKKFSGNAQHRARKYILHHGTILYDFDLSLIERYLKIPRDVPPYRQGRSHKEFVTNIGIPAFEIKAAFRKKFSPADEPTAVSERERQCLQEFLATKKIVVEKGNKI